MTCISNRHAKLLGNIVDYSFPKIRNQHGTGSFSTLRLCTVLSMRSMHLSFSYAPEDSIGLTVLLFPLRMSWSRSGCSNGLLRLSKMSKEGMCVFHVAVVLSHKTNMFMEDTCQMENESESTLVPAIMQVENGPLGD